jgi:hypothetical protein
VITATTGAKLANNNNAGRLVLPIN